MPKQTRRVSGSSSTRPVSSAPGTAFHKEVQQPTAKTQDDAPEFDPTRPASFDLEGFISGARSHTNTRVVPITSNPGVAGELAALTFEKDKLVEVIAEDKASEGGTSKRLSAKSIRARRLDEINARMAELDPELEGTWVEVKLRAATIAERDGIRAAKMAPGIDLAGYIFSIVAGIRAAGSDDEWARMTGDQWADFFEAIGIEQYTTLDQTFESLAYQGVTPDFYERYSASRATRPTSSS